jgi:hypothetical protein
VKTNRWTPLVGFWSRWFTPDPDPKTQHIKALEAEIAFLRTLFVTTQEKLISMADPLLKQREATIERQRMGGPIPPINNNPNPRSHNPQILAMEMEERDRRRHAEANRVREPDEVERAFRRTD